MDMKFSDISRILEVFKESEYEFLEIACGDVHIVADRTGRTVLSGSAQLNDFSPGLDRGSGLSNEFGHERSPARPIPPGAAQTSAAGETSATNSDSDDSTAVELDGTAQMGETVAVVAPIVGIFYSAPEPDAPPYVALGDTVAVGDTLGLVEVMKVFNSVAAPVSGEVVGIFVESEDLVEFSQEIMRIRPVDGE